MLKRLDDEGLETLLKLVEKADAIFEGNRPGVAERLGFGPDEWSAARLETLGFQAYIDEQLDPVMLQIGDESNVESTYIGLLSFAIFFEVTSDAAGEDIVAQLREDPWLRQALEDAL